MSVILIMVLFIGLSSGNNQCENKTELDSCLAKIAPHMPRTGLPHDKQQLDKMCKSFKGGMVCVDGYTSRCMTPSQREALEEHLKGARYVLTFLCDDPVFRKEYLRNAQCIEDVSDDWDHCHAHFKQLVSREHAIKNVTQEKRDKKICCIRESLLQCVYGVSYLKCTKPSAVFLKKVTATLSYSDVQQEKCKNVDIRTCSSSVVQCECLLLFVLLMLLVLVQFNHR